MVVNDISSTHRLHENVQNGQLGLLQIRQRLERTVRDGATWPMF